MWVVQNSSGSQRATKLGGAKLIRVTKVHTKSGGAKLVRVTRKQPSVKAWLPGKAGGEAACMCWALHLWCTSRRLLSIPCMHTAVWGCASATSLLCVCWLLQTCRLHTCKFCHVCLAGCSLKKTRMMRPAMMSSPMELAAKLEGKFWRAAAHTSRSACARLLATVCVAALAWQHVFIPLHSTLQKPLSSFKFPRLSFTQKYDAVQGPDLLLATKIQGENS
eukprot:1158485-Pelagomonas_calceolata.AAC.6